MSWIPDWLKSCFSNVAPKQPSPSTPEKETALRQITRHHLEVFANGPKGSDARYIHMKLFLDELESVATGSALDHPLGMSAQVVRVGARQAVMTAASGGKVPFFYENDASKTVVYADDMYVPVKYLATHALSLLNGNHSPALASLYAAALEGQSHRTHSQKGLSESKTLGFVDAGGNNGQFQVGAVDDPYGSRPQIILRTSKPEEPQP